MRGSAARRARNAGRWRPVIAALGWGAWALVLAWALGHVEWRSLAPLLFLTLVPVCWAIRAQVQARREPDRVEPRDDSPQAVLGTGSDSSDRNQDSVTGSGFYDPPSGMSPASDAGLVSGEFSLEDMVNRLEPNGFRWIDSSHAEQLYLGYTLNELKQRSFLDVLHPHDRPIGAEIFRQVLSRGEVHGVVLRVQTAQGKTRAVELTAGARYSSENRVTYVRCHLRDVTERLRAEKHVRLRTRELIQVNEQLRQINRELESLKNRYADLYHNAPAMYLSLDAEGRLVECNQTFLARLGLERGDVIGKGIDRFVLASELAHCRLLIAQLMKKGSLEGESRWVSSRGEPIHVLVSGTMTPGTRDAAYLTHCVAQDISAQKKLEAELQTTNNSLQHANAELSNRNRELDEFAYAVSHDLQEPLRTMMAFSSYLLKDHADQLGSEGTEYVRHLVDASRRMKAMIGGLLKLSRAGHVTEAFTTVALGDLVAAIRTDLAELLRARGAEIRLLDQDIVLWGDAQRLQQLLANLISNGIKYNLSPQPTVEIGRHSAPDPAPNASPGADPEAALVGAPHLAQTPTRDAAPRSGDPYLQTIVVRDNGIGIDRRYHRRIFQVFRRLHAQEEFEGTGIGLAICNKIVQAHGGEIRLESEPGQGTTFFLTLPRMSAMPPAQPASPLDT